MILTPFLAEATRCQQVFELNSLTKGNSRSLQQRFEDTFNIFKNIEDKAIRRIQPKVGDEIPVLERTPEVISLHKKYAGFVLPTSTPLSTLIYRMLAILDLSAAQEPGEILTLSGDGAEFLNFVVGKKDFVVGSHVSRKQILDIRFGTSFRLAVDFAYTVYLGHRHRPRLDPSDILQGAFEGLVSALQYPDLRDKLILDDQDQQIAVSLATGVYKFLYRPTTVAAFESGMLNDYRSRVYPPQRGRSQSDLNEDGHRLNLRYYVMFTRFLKVKNLLESLKSSAESLDPIMQKAAQFDMVFDAEAFRKDREKGLDLEAMPLDLILLTYFAEVKQGSLFWESYQDMALALAEYNLPLDPVLASVERDLKAAELKRTIPILDKATLETFLDDGGVGKLEHNSDMKRLFWVLLANIFGRDNLIRVLSNTFERRDPRDFQGFFRKQIVLQRQLLILLYAYGYLKEDQPWTLEDIGKLFSPPITKQRVRQLKENALRTVKTYPLRERWPEDIWLLYDRAMQ